MAKNWKLPKLKYFISELKFIYLNALLTDATLDYNRKIKVHTT